MLVLCSANCIHNKSKYGYYRLCKLRSDDKPGYGGIDRAYVDSCIFCTKPVVKNVHEDTSDQQSAEDWDRWNKTDCMYYTNEKCLYYDDAHPCHHCHYYKTIQIGGDISEEATKAET